MQITLQWGMWDGRNSGHLYKQIMGKSKHMEIIKAFDKY